MKKRDFTQPFWWVVVLGVFYVLSTGATLLFGKPEDGGVGFGVLSLAWVGVLAGEAVLYWRIRKRNEARKESWAHVVTLAFTFLVPVFRGAMVEAFFGEVFGEQIGKEMTDYFSWEKTAVYWTLMALAHVFFGRVLWKAFVVGEARAGGSRGDGGEVRGDGVQEKKEEKLKDGRPVVGITILPEPEQKDMLDDIWN